MEVNALKIVKKIIQEGAFEEEKNKTQIKF